MILLVPVEGKLVLSRLFQVLHALWHEIVRFSFMILVYVAHVVSLAHAALGGLPLWCSRRLGSGGFLLCGLSETNPEDLVHAFEDPVKSLHYAVSSLEGPLSDYRRGFSPSVLGGSCLDDL